MKKTLLLLFCCLLACGVQAEVVPARIFQSGMVLQRSKPVPVWGTASPGEQFTIVFNKKSYVVRADAKGRWRVDLPAMKAGGPYTMTFAHCQLDDILIGDVWLCTGQSNMDLPVSRVQPQYPGFTEDYANDRVRLLRVDQVASVSGPQTDFKTSGWQTLTPASSRDFSALGYFLGRRLQSETGIPQGIICNSWGGTPIEAWLPADSLQRDFPQYTARTSLYTPDYVASQTRANQLMNDRWQQLLDETDPGMHQGWTGLGFDDGTWPAANQYARDWAQVDGRGVVGSVWMRQHVHIDAAHAGRPALLVLGMLYDADHTYVNGRRVGVTYYQYPPRRYAVPAGLLHEGDNVIAVRFVNKTGTPAFTRGKKYQLEFTPDDVLQLSEQWRSHIGARMPACPQQDVTTQYLPTVMHNSMLHPLIPYALAGVVWYQGESNTDRAGEYRTMLRKLKGDWRTQFADSSLSVVIVQLANFMAPSSQPQESGWAELREAQRLSVLEDPHAALAVAIDLGEANDIHPLRKRELADRVALALDRLRGNRHAALSPQPVAARLMSRGVGGQSQPYVVVRFDQKLRPADTLSEFELRSEDGRFHNVEARVSGNTVVIALGTVSRPTAVRYAWKNNPEQANLYNPEGLPASPFQITVEP